jgi:hypothetical protein
MSGGQALGTGEVISNGLIDWSLRVRRELSDAVMSAAYIHADNVILHIHRAAAQAVTPTHPQSTQHILIKLKQIRYGFILQAYTLFKLNVSEGNTAIQLGSNLFQFEHFTFLVPEYAQRQF